MTSPKRVLIIDDSKIALAVSRRLLESIGLMVRAIDSPADFVAALREFQPELAIVDVEMPAVGGPKLVEIARSHGLLEGIPVLLQSSIPEAEGKALVASCRVAGFISKSGDGSNFVRRVREALHLDEAVEFRAPLPALAATLEPLPEPLRTGIAWMDQHHQLLFDAAARLDRSVRQGSGARNVGETLAFLRRYAAFHFGAEERKMSEAGFRESGSHSTAHVAFRANLEQMSARHDREGADEAFARQLHGFISSWLSDHVNHYDRLFVRHLQATTRAA